MSESLRDRRVLRNLLLLVAKQERAAFDEIYHLTAAQLFGVSLRILNDRNDAEEAVQEAFVKIWRNAGSFRPSDASPRYWLVSIVRNTAIDILRKRRARSAVPTEDVEPPEAPTPEAFAVASSDAERLYECLDELAPERAALIKKAYFQGLTYVELSAEVRAPLSTVKSWVRRSLKVLRECIGRLPGEENTGDKDRGR